MKSKKTYEALEVEVIFFDREDVIRTSDSDTTTPTQPANNGLILY